MVGFPDAPEAGERVDGVTIKFGKQPGRCMRMMSSRRSGLVNTWANSHDACGAAGRWAGAAFVTRPHSFQCTRAHHHWRNAGAIAATVRSEHPSPARCRLRSGSMMDGHRIPWSLSARAIAATPRPANRWPKIQARDESEARRPSNYAKTASSKGSWPGSAPTRTVEPSPLAVVDYLRANDVMIICTRAGCAFDTPARHAAQQPLIITETGPPEGARPAETNPQRAIRGG
jgi:hypothetical protein